MKAKQIIRKKLKSFSGISELEKRVSELELQIKAQAKPDLVRKLEERALSASAEFIELNMEKAKALTTNLEVIDFALKRVSKQGLFCEFGVFQGATINHIAKQTKSKVYGFDSFKGLPEFWRDGFPAGAFNKSGNLPKCEENVELIVGWFDETLPKFIREHSEQISFLHVDCDLYSSTKTIFKNLEDRLSPGAIIVFDEYFNYPGWQAHEHLAFQQFIETGQQKFEYIAFNRFHEQVAIQIL